MIEPFETEEQAARVQAAVHRGGQHRQGRTPESPTRATGNPVATINLPGPSSTGVNSMTTDGSATEAFESSAACRRLYAVYEDYSAKAPVVENDQIPSDLFV